MKALQRSHDDLKRRVDAVSKLDLERQAKEAVQRSVDGQVRGNEAQLEGLREEVTETARSIGARCDAIAGRVDELEHRWESEGNARDVERLVRCAREGDESCLEEIEQIVSSGRLSDAEVACMAHAAGIIHLRRHDATAALGHFERAVALAPERSHATAGLGQALLELDRAEDACAHLRAAAERFPDDPVVSVAFAVALYATDRVTEALLHLRAAIRLDPDLLAPYLILHELGFAEAEGVDILEPVRQLLAG